MKKRILYLDILKTIAIFLVCSYHFSWVENYMFNAEIMNIETYLNRFLIGTWSTCIPLFFMINGALLLNKSDFIPQKHLYKIITLILTFFVWRGITIILLSSRIGILKSSGIRNILNSIIFNAGLPGVDTAHFWFIPTLISIYFIYPFIYEMYRTKNGWLKFFMMITFTGCFLFNDFKNILGSTSTFGKIDFEYFSYFIPFKEMNLGLLFYFIMGGWLHRDRDKLICLSTIKLLMMFFAGKIGLFIEWLLTSKNIGSNWDNIFNGYITLPTLLMSISVYLLVCKYYNKIENHKKISACFEIIGNNTLSVYYIHWIVGYTFLGYIRNSCIIQDGIVANYLKSLVMILVISLLSQKIKKYHYYKK